MKYLDSNGFWTSVLDIVVVLAMAAVFFLVYIITPA